MATSPHVSDLPDDPALAGGEWLYRRGGEVFGPVDSRRLASLLYAGEIEGGTPVSADGASWAPVGEVPLFHLHARKAEAGLRVEREVTGSRLLVRRKRRRAALLVLLLSAAAVGGAGLLAFLLAPRRGQVSPLLEDFGEGIRVTSARVVSSGRARADDEVEVSLSRIAPGATKRAERPAAGAGGAKPAPRPAAEPADDLVATHFDAGRIQATVNKEQHTLAPCFREEAARSVDFRGQVPLEFAIANDGRVAALWIDEPRFREGALRECLLRSLAAWRFDPFPGQRATVQLAFSIGR